VVPARLLTYREVAERLALHPNTVRRLVARGELAKVRVGGSVRVHPAAVEALIAAGSDRPVQVADPALRTPGRAEEARRAGRRGTG